MELTGKGFCMVSDKELLLQILNLNNIPTLELVDPKTSPFPIIGRRYGHHSGKDITVINTKEQPFEEGFDYFTKLYAFENEYCLEIEGLSMKSAKILVGEQVIFYEIPIRTESFGWRLQDVEPNSVPQDIIATAVRALYVTGMNSGLVKIGILPNGKIMVIDVNEAENPYVEPVVRPATTFSMGADIEFMLSCDNQLLPASTFFPVEGDVGCDERQIEQDSGEYALAEIRPEKANTPRDLLANIRKLIVDAANLAPYENVEFRAGSMPFWGYQCGGHIHFGLPPTLSLVRALDHYLAVPLAMVEESRTAKLRRKTKHGGLGRFRLKPYGFEYLSLSSWIIDPQLAIGVLSLACLVAIHHSELESHFLYNPIVQRAYYQGNKIILREFWSEIKKRLMNTTSFQAYEQELTFLFKAVEEGYPFQESSDIRTNWGISPPETKYNRGLVILIPKKTRLKYDLKEGLTTYIKAGTRLSAATIHPYPFTFRNSNIVQLSGELRERLALPNEWNPKLSVSNGVLSLGPIIGILAVRPFDRQSTYFEHLGRLASEKQMLTYVFEIKDIDWEKELIKGTTLNGVGYFPFPAVIYDRAIITGVNKDGIDKARAKLQSVYHIPFINPLKVSQLTGNKWETHSLLQKAHGKFLPQTRILTSASELKEMLDQFGEIYLKPLGGTLSKGVIRVVRRPSGIFWINTKAKIATKLPKMDELISRITALMKKGPYLIQEGIRRKQYNGRNLEIRVYMQKNGMQKWFRTGMVTRLTAEDVMTEETELNLRISKVLSHLYPDLAERRMVTSRLGKVAKDIVNTIEKEVGSFGEMAVDLCIDQYDSIKLLEVNSKPDNLFSQIRAYQLRNLAGIRLLNYAASLAGYEGEDHRL